MSEYISRDVAKAFFTPPKGVTFLTPLYFRQEDVIATLDNIPAAFEDAQVAPLPAADVRPVVRGKWDERIGKDSAAIEEIRAIPAADVLPRDEAIKMGAELAAMHGSDATSQQLEEAYLKGVEYGMTRRDVRPVVLCRDCKYWEYDAIFADGWCRGKHQGNPNWFCADGEKMEES